MAKFIEVINKVERVTGKVVDTTGLLGPVHAAVCWTGKIAMRHEKKKILVEYEQLKKELDKEKSEQIKEVIAKEYEVKDA